MAKRGQSSRVAALARAALERVRWETELGVAGYPPASPAATAAEPRASSDADPAAELEKLCEEIGDCTRCPLHAGRTRLVFGEGGARPLLALVGEGPGREEDASGRPFVGAAGQLLDRILAAIGLGRGDVYICNVVKCRPPGNRAPEPEEAEVCARFLRRQLEILAPEVIVTLGASAARTLLETEQPVGRLRGRFHDYRGVPLMPTYHPAYLLRNAGAKRPVWEDMKQVRDRLGLAPVSPGTARAPAAGGGPDR